jgi:hypothetical protein
MFGKDKSSGGAPQQSIADMMRMAQSMQADAMQQAHTMGAATGGSAVGSMNWARQVMALIAPPQPGYVKRCSCTNCGAPKKLPSVTAYVYCDYCGSLIDYDLRRASESDVPVGLEYANLVNGLQRNCMAAQAAGDREAYRAMQKQIYAAYVTSMPNAVSHRARNDESYRQQLVDYMAESALMTAFEPELIALTGEMQQRVVGLRYTGMMMVDPASFWPMCETLNRQIETTGRLAQQYGLDERDPDRAAHLNTKMACSGFCQGWLHMLPQDTAAQLIEWAGPHQHLRGGRHRRWTSPQLRRVWQSFHVAPRRHHDGVRRVRAAARRGRRRDPLHALRRKHDARARCIRRDVPVLPDLRSQGRDGLAALHQHRFVDCQSKL